MAKTKWTWTQSAGVEFGCPLALVDEVFEEQSAEYVPYLSFDPDKNCQTYLQKKYPEISVLERELIKEPTTNLGLKEGSFSSCITKYFTPARQLMGGKKILKLFFSSDPQSFARSTLVDYYSTQNRLKNGALMYLLQVAAIDFELGTALLPVALSGQSGYGGKDLNPIRPYVQHLSNCPQKKNGLTKLTEILSNILIEHSISRWKIERLTAAQKKKTEQNYYEDRRIGEEKTEFIEKLFPWINEPDFKNISSWRRILNIKDPFDKIGGKSSYSESASHAKMKIFNSIMANQDEIKKAIKRQLLVYRTHMTKRLDEISEASRCLHSQSLGEKMRFLACSRHVNYVLSYLSEWDASHMTAKNTNIDLFRALSDGQCRMDTKRINQTLLMTEAEILFTILPLGGLRGLTKLAGNTATKLFSRAGFVANGTKAMGTAALYNSRIQSTIIGIGAVGLAKGYKACQTIAFNKLDDDVRRFQPSITNTPEAMGCFIEDADDYTLSSAVKLKASTQFNYLSMATCVLANSGTAQ